MNKFLLLATFFLLTPFVLFFTLVFALFTIYKATGVQVGNNFITSQRSVSYAALANNENSIKSQITQADARIELISNFLSRYNSPLLPYAEQIVKDADTYNLDFRLIPAIAMQESNLCKKIPLGSNNCWGFGIYGGKVLHFNDFGHGVSTVTKALAIRYKGRGLVTPEQIMSMYTPGSNGSWANGVNYFMTEIQ